VAYVGVAWYNNQLLLGTENQGLISVISVRLLGELGIKALAYAQNSPFIHSFIHIVT